jgi:hypothetical protein
VADEVRLWAEDETPHAGVQTVGADQVEAPG